MGRGAGRWSVNGNQLKLLAIFAMLVDHWAIVFVPGEFAGLWLLRLVGRLTAPIMCYLIAEGYWHTSDLRRYLGRLLLVALVSHIPHALCFGFDPWRFWEATDVMFALLLGLVALAAWAAPSWPCGKSWGPRRAAACCLPCGLELHRRAVDRGVWGVSGQPGPADAGLLRRRRPLSFAAPGVRHLFPLHQPAGGVSGHSPAAVLQRPAGAQEQAHPMGILLVLPRPPAAVVPVGAAGVTRKARQLPGLFSVLRQQKRQAEWLASFRWWR